MKREKLDSRCWMKNIDDSKEVLSLNLAGTHDCVARYVQFSRLARCQSLSIYHQLLIGIRGLDIRVKSDGERLLMVHGNANAYNNALRLGGQMDMVDVLADCYRFLERFPSECIVFQFKNDSNLEREKCFNNLYNTYIKKNKKAWFLENRSPSIKEARGKIILLRRCKMEEREEYTDMNTGIDFSRWVEQDDAVNEPLYLETLGKHSMTFYIQDRYAYKPEPRWNEVIVPFLEERKKFDGTYVINYLSTAGGIKGPYENSKYINPRFMDYPLEKGVYYGMTYIDFPSKELVEKIINSNGDLL